MPAPKTISGARAIVKIDNVQVGIFNDFSYGVQHGIQPVNILGRFSAAETVYTATEVVRCQATGWRVFDHGPSVSAKFPHVGELLEHTYFNIEVYDRVNMQTPIAKIWDVRPESYSTSFATKQLSSVVHSFIGLLCDDEKTTNAESLPVGDLPS